MSAELEGRPLACVPGAIPAAERAAHFALIQRLFARAEARAAHADGYDFRFPADALEDIARFVANERKCCPFQGFTITVPADAAEVRLRLAGPRGTREFLDHELPKHGVEP